MVMTLLTRPKKAVATVIIATDGSGDYNTDGTADDVEIQAALDSLPATGGCIYMKEGVYNINATITFPNIDIALIGCGRCTQITSNIQDIHFLSATNISGILIQNIYLTGQTSSNPGAVLNSPIYFNNTDDSQINTCWLDDNDGPGVWFVNCTENILSMDKIDTCLYGILFQGTTYSITTDSIITNCLSEGMIITASSDNNLIISNQIIDNIADGLSLGNTVSSSIINNKILSNGQNGIETSECAMVNITGNEISRNNVHGILLDGFNCVISSNIVSDNDFDNDASQNGITVSFGNWNVITGNRCQNNDNYEIYVGPGSFNNTVSGNNCVGMDHEGTIVDDGTNTQIFNNIEE